jgi:Protein of unknown function
MNRDIAEEIHKHLLAAAAALRRAERAGQKLRIKRERRDFMELLIDVTMPLHFELLRALYRQHPELRPPEKGEISSTLRWEEVSLPKSVSTNDLDAAILEVLTARLQKVAKVITDTAERCRALRGKSRFDIISARIIALAEAGRIEGAGDLRKWRNSEVRLRP